MMPRQGPIRPRIIARLDQADHDEVCRRAANEANGNQSEMVRRLIRYALRHLSGEKP